MTSIKTQKIVFPTQKINAKFSVQGIFAIPQEWKTTDEANPGLFTYAVRMSKFQIIKGKVVPRQLTQRQKKQLQQKSKKGGKKQSKNPQPNLEQQRIRKQEEQKQKARQQLFAKLTPEQQFYYNSQDVYKAPSLKFQSNSSQCQFVGKNCLILEQRLLQDKGQWIYVYKMPSVSQDQLAKMRKSKPKTLNNINDLNPLIMRAWLSFQQLSQSSQAKQIKEVRCKLTQVDKTPQTSEPNLQNTYIKVNFVLNQPVIKEKDQYNTLLLINDPSKPSETPAEIRCVEQLRQQLSLAIQSLAMQYSTMFWKQINMQEQQRNLNVFLNNKKGESTKRKQQFLYDFNVTGKYKIFKDRVKKCIVRICQTKYKDTFAGMKTFNGIKCNGQDQIYSEIYNMLVTSYQDTLFKIIEQKKQNLGEVLVLNNQTLKSSTQLLLNSYKQQTISQRVRRIIQEYELVQDSYSGQKIIKKYIQEYPHVIQLKYQFGIYCLKYNLKSTKDVLPYIEEYLTQEKYQLTDQKKIQYMLILFNIGGENSAKGWIILREIIQNALRAKNQQNQSGQLSRWLVLASVVLKTLGKSELAAKYLSSAVREYHISKVPKENSQSHSHKESPIKNQLPTITGIVNYGNEQSKQTLDLLYFDLISYLSNFSTFELIKKVSQQKAGKIVQNNQEKNELNIGSFDECLPELNQLLVSHNAYGVERLLKLSTLLYEKVSGSEKNKPLEFIIKGYLLKMINSESSKTEDLLQLQTYLKKSLMSNTDSQYRFVTLLRLGYIYCLKQQYGNARACLLKYLQKASSDPNCLSGLSYKLLGISCLNSNRIQQAVESFKHWNLCDCKKYEPWLYLALAYSKLKNLILVKQCLSQYHKRVTPENLTQEQKNILNQIKDQLYSKSVFQSQYDNTIKSKILQTLA